MSRASTRRRARAARTKVSAGSAVVRRSALSPLRLLVALSAVALALGALVAAQADQGAAAVALLLVCPLLVAVLALGHIVLPQQQA